MPPAKHSYLLLAVFVVIVFIVHRLGPPFIGFFWAANTMRWRKKRHPSAVYALSGPQPC